MCCIYATKETYICHCHPRHLLSKGHPYVYISFSQAVIQYNEEMYTVSNNKLLCCRDFRCMTNILQCICLGCEVFAILIITSGVWLCLVCSIQRGGAGRGGAGQGGGVAGQLVRNFSHFPVHIPPPPLRVIFSPLGCVPNNQREISGNSAPLIHEVGGSTSAHPPCKTRHPQAPSTVK